MAVAPRVSKHEHTIQSELQGGQQEEAGWAGGHAGALRLVPAPSQEGGPPCPFSGTPSCPLPAGLTQPLPGTERRAGSSPCSKPLFSSQHPQVQVHLGVTSCLVAPGNQTGQT